VPARVLVAHKFFFPHGGIERHLFDLRGLLGRHGHEVVDFSMVDPRNLPSPYARHFVSNRNFDLTAGGGGLRLLGRMLYSVEAHRRIGRLVDETRPDVAHLLSIYHQLSPSILSALHRRRLPIVQKLADYKIVCPAYTLFSGGSVCERCAGGRVYQVALRRCHRGGWGPNLALALEAVLHRWILRSHALVDLFLAPSRFLMDKVRAMGLRARVRLLPNFVALDRWTPAPLPPDPIVAYVGRLVPEKGVDVLVRAMEGVAARLWIFGTGPERPSLERLVRERGLRQVIMFGQLDQPELRERLAACRCVVQPAVWYENNPHAVLEACAMGRPVIASDIGGLSEIVVHGETGLLVPSGDPGRLREAIRWLCEDRALAHRLGLGGRALVEARHGPEEFYRGLCAAYQEVGA
jgi:glycosyltransferase involved in cell wall biosynthesis